MARNYWHSFIFVFVDRVSRDRLPPVDKDLQPTNEWDAKDYPARPKDGSPIRAYRKDQSAVDTSLNPNVFKWNSVPFKKNGIWQYSHQFSEVSAFILLDLRTLAFHSFAHRLH